MRFYGVTDKGLVRKMNQDSYVIAPNDVGDIFALICDGIGGARAGDVASKIAVEYFSAVFSETHGFKDEEDIVTWVRYHVSKVNDYIFSKSTTTNIYKGMGTTLVGLMITKAGTYTINIGDSRVYCINKEKRFVQLTMDHTLVQDMVNHGELTPEEAENHPKKNVLTNALGVWGTARVDVKRVREKPESYLLCSDGLFGYVEKRDIVKVLVDDELSTILKARRLLNLALRAGGFDNVTIILIEMEATDQYE